MSDLSPSDLPIGPLVDPHPAPRPAPVTLVGRLVSVVPLDAKAHARALYDRSSGEANEHLWAYLFNGPFPDFAAFEADVEAKSQAADPLYFAVVDNASGEAVGYQSLMRIDPTHRVIEIGGILYTPALQGAAGSTEAQYLFARHVFDDLGYRRYEWKCNDFNAPVQAGGAAARLRLRGRVPPAYDREGQEPRHRLVRDAGFRMARAPRRLRALARSGQFRCARATEDEPCARRRRVKLKSSGSRLS